MKSRISRVLLAVAVGMLVVFLLLERRHQRESITDLRRDMATLARAEDARPKYIPVPVAMPRERYESARLAPVLPELGETQAVPTGAPAAPTSPEVQLAETHARYEHLFSSDRTESDWAPKAQRIAYDKLPGLLPPGSTIQSIECRASLCRIETWHKDRDAYWRFLRSAFLGPAHSLWNGGTYSTPLNDDLEGGQMVTYIARDGEALPSLVD